VRLVKTAHALGTMLAMSAIESFFGPHFLPVSHLGKFEAEEGKIYLLLWKTEEFIHFTLLDASDQQLRILSLHPDTQFEQTTYDNYTNNNPKWSLIGVWTPNNPPERLRPDTSAKWDGSTNTCLHFCLATLGISNYNPHFINLNVWIDMLADERFVKTYMITEAAITIAHVTAKKSKQLENE